MRKVYQAPRPRAGDEVARRDLTDYDRLFGITDEQQAEWAEVA
ncbi:hypothetical protein ABZ807_01485 [Micromonospora sp. NPDC047548]